jgi:hypothetical protein
VQIPPNRQKYLHIGGTTIISINHLLELVYVIHPALVEASNLGELAANYAFDFVGVGVFVNRYKLGFESEILPA